MTLKKQLVFGFGLLLAVSMSMTVISSLSTSKLIRYQRLAGMSAEQHSDLQRLQIALNRELASIHSFAMYGREQSIEKLKSNAAATEKLLEHLVGTVHEEIAGLEEEEEIEDEEETEAIYEEFGELHHKLLKEFDQVIALKKAGKEQEAIDKLSLSHQQGYESQLSNLIEVGIEAENKEKITRKGHYDRAAEETTTFAFAECIGVSIVSAIALGFLFRSLHLIREAEEEKEALQKELLQLAHEAGMSEIATSTVHNVGNAINGINTSAQVMVSTIDSSVTSGLAQVLKILDEQSDNLGEFLNADPRGKKLPEYFRSLAPELDKEKEVLRGELDRMNEKLDHIKTIISVQQDFARAGVFEEDVKLSDVINDTFSLLENDFTNGKITLERDIEVDQPVKFAKARLVEVLLNLFKNSIDAIVEQNATKRVIKIVARYCDEGQISIAVSDTGIGIPAENFTRMFQHGFSTKERGHGFGLHSCANAITQMNGSISAHSDGPGEGATFTVRLPFEPAAEPEATAIGY